MCEPTQDMVVRAIKHARCNLYELLKRALQKEGLVRNSIEIEKRARADFAHFKDKHAYPDYLVEYCSGLLGIADRPPPDNVRNLSARREGIPDINARRKPKR